MFRGKKESIKTDSMVPENVEDVAELFEDTDDQDDEQVEKDNDQDGKIEALQKKIAMMERANPSLAKPKEFTRVVKELPTQVIRRAQDDKGNIINLLTIEEALTKLLAQEE